MTIQTAIAADLSDAFDGFGCIIREALLSGKSAIDAKLANGDAYIMTLEDAEDRAHRSVMTRTDMLTGIEWASWKPLSSERWFSVALNVPLCGGCDHPLDANGDCEMCSEATPSHEQEVL